MRMGSKIYKSVELEELFFYTLYNFTAYWEIGRVSEQAGKLISRSTGYNVKNYHIRLHNNELKHILARHFFETSRNQRDVCFEDMKEMGFVVNQSTEVKKGNRANTLVFAKRYPGKNETYIFVVSIDITHKTLWGKNILGKG